MREYSAGRRQVVIQPFFNDESEEGLRSKVCWVEEKFEVNDRFFSNVLRVDVELFAGWKNRQGHLPEGMEQGLRAFWEAFAHILSYMNFDFDRTREMFEFRSERNPSFPISHFDPPWLGSSLKEYLQERGIEGIDKVNRWVQAMRFSNAY